MAVVFIPPRLRELTQGKTQVEVEGGSVREVIEALERRFPGIQDRLVQDDALMPGLQVSIGGTLSTRGLLAKVGPDAEVHFLPVFGGG